MTTEEKARAYDEALEDMRAIYPNLKGDAKLAIEHAFHELSESEDERIRKAIVHILYENYSDAAVIEGVAIAEIVTWLEKQKELPMPNSTELIDMWDAEKAMLKEKDFRDDAWRLAYNAFMDGFAKGTCVKFEKQKEQKPDDDPLDDPKFLKGFDTGREVQRIFDEQKPAEWSEEDKEMLLSIINAFRNGTVSTIGQEQWLKSLHKRFNLEPKQEWSEEDEKKITFLERLIRYNVPEGQYGWVDGHKGGFVTKLEAISMLKSLRPQPKKELSIEKAIQWLDDTFYFLDNSSGRGRDCEITTHDFDSLEEMYDSFRKAVTVDFQPSWKPSEEQMKALQNAVALTACDKELVRLYNQLLKGSPLPEDTVIFQKGVAEGRRLEREEVPRWKKGPADSAIRTRDYWPVSNAPVLGKPETRDYLIVKRGKSMALAFHAEEGDYYLSTEELDKIPTE